ncbi:hypothetical protein K443DRAFT_687145 [Laccaria amethystina LaAM-08-1]|uniref:Uncharacterized protein n=1 Tax=Laccaria amethystina LaAM-08-1 TaxID=1095629 RepID=A0A0C9WZG6_9AGAR|nr:hypothetical protein K443DRAFT_687145 [Laccaria amethystina LaAM-08-1]
MVAFALNPVRSPYSCNTFLPVNYCQVTRDRRQTETRRCPHGAERLVMKQSVCGPALQLRV